MERPGGVALGIASGTSGNSLWLLHSALAEGDNVTLIALWNGQEGDGPGGTRDLVERARKRKARVVPLDTRALFGIG